MASFEAKEFLREVQIAKHYLGIVTGTWEWKETLEINLFTVKK